MCSCPPKQHLRGLSDVLIIRPKTCGLTRRSHVLLAFNRSHSKLALIASNTAHAIDRPQLLRARLPPTPPRGTRRERVHLARFSILPVCMQTPDDVCCSSRSHPKRRSIATPALIPNAPARCWNLVDEYDSASDAASAPSASASRLASGMLSSTIDLGSGCAPPRPASSAL